MKESNTEPLVLERALHWCGEKVRTFRIPLLCAFLSGMLAYCFCFTNKLLNHDEAFCLFSKGATLDSGRWMLGLLDAIFPNVSMPWIYGILSVAIVSVATCVIVNMFSVKNKLLQGLLAGLIVVFPSLIGLFSYMFTSTSFTLAFLLSVVAVYFAKRNTWVDRGICFACLTISLGIYQSYISVAASLMVLLLIQMLLQGERTANVIRRGGVYIALLLMAMVCYYGLAKIALAWRHLDFNGYANKNMALQIADIPQKIIAAYQNFINIFRYLQYRLIINLSSRRLHILILAVTAGLLVIWLLNLDKKDFGRILLIGVLLMLLPLAINCIYLVVEESAVHTLVLYSFISLYILAVLVADHMLECAPKKRKVFVRFGTDLMALTMAGVVFINIYAANAAYLNLYLHYENSYAFYTSLATQIKSHPDFDENSKVAIIGEYATADYEWNLQDVSSITGCWGFSPDSYSWGRFLKYYIGFPIASAGDIQNVLDSETYAQMPVYPYYGSFEKIDDIFVVKLSE